MLEFWVPLVIYIKSNGNSISLLCISLHKDKEGIVLFAIKIKRSSNFPINDLRSNAIFFLKLLSSSKDFERYLGVLFP